MSYLCCGVYLIAISAVPSYLQSGWTAKRALYQQQFIMIYFDYATSPLSGIIRRGPDRDALNSTFLIIHEDIEDVISRLEELRVEQRRQKDFSESGRLVQNQDAKVWYLRDLSVLEAYCNAGENGRIIESKEVYACYRKCSRVLDDFRKFVVDVKALSLKEQVKAVEQRKEELRQAKEKPADICELNMREKALRDQEDRRQDKDEELQMALELSREYGPDLGDLSGALYWPNVAQRLRCEMLLFANHQMDIISEDTLETAMQSFKQRSRSARVQHPGALISLRDFLFPRRGWNLYWKGLTQTKDGKMDYKLYESKKCAREKSQALNLIPTAQIGCPENTQ